ncbi:MAG: DUF202 domain-containing protein [Planctomycetia bacterium]|nr:DUF202 domain-containing protein [Planctomycetia bacterium]
MDDERRRADDLRMRLAGEQTLLAWVRTGVALMGLGFVVARFGLFLREIAVAEHLLQAPRSGFSLWIGTGLILLGVVVSMMAAWEHALLLRRMDEGAAYRPPRRSLAIIVAVVLALIGIAMAGYMLFIGGGE